MPENMIEKVPELSQQTQQILIGISILIGLVNCLFGYRIFRFIIALWGFVFGAVVGSLVGMAFYDSAGGIIGAIVGGLLCAVLAYVLYFVGIFLLGAGLAALLCSVGFAAGGQQPLILVLVPAAIVGGILALILQKLLIILATSFGGAWTVATGVFALLGKAPDFAAMAEHPELMEGFLAQNMGLIACWLGFGVAGVVVQYSLTARRKKQEPPELPRDKSRRAQSRSRQ